MKPEFSPDPLVSLAVSALQSEQDEDQVRLDLLSRGIDRVRADRTIDLARAMLRQTGLRAGLKYLAIGVCCGALGLVITGSTSNVAIGLFSFGIGFTLAGIIRLSRAAVLGR